MYIIAREVNEQTEYLTDTSSTTRKVFKDYTSAENFVNKLNSHIQSNKKWYVVKVEEAKES